MKKTFISFVLILCILLPTSFANASKIGKHLPVRPQKGVRITSGFGYRIHPITGKKKFHNGIDIGAPIGTHIHTYMNGEVVMARNNGTAGNEVKIKHAGGLETRYLHMDKRAVNVGDKVRAGRIIGTVGATGRVTGPHLHFELRKNNRAINPMK